MLVTQKRSLGAPACGYTTDGGPVFPLRCVLMYLGYKIDCKSLVVQGSSLSLTRDLCIDDIENTKTLRPKRTL